MKVALAVPLRMDLEAEQGLGKAKRTGGSTISEMLGAQPGPFQGQVGHKWRDSVPKQPSSLKTKRKGGKVFSLP